MTSVEIAKRRLDEAGLVELGNVKICDLDESKPTELPSTWSPEGVRNTLSRFVNAIESHVYPDIDDLEVVSMLMERVLQVDMDDKRNRRGDIPKALGLVHKPYRDYERRVLAYAFNRTVIDIWDEEISKDVKINIKQAVAIELGIKAFYQNGIELSIDEATSLFEYGADL